MTDDAFVVEPVQTAEPVPPAASGRAPLNPVLARELRVRLRGGRAWVLLTAYLVVLGGICLLVYEAESASVSEATFVEAGLGVAPAEFTSVGRSIFEWLVFFMLLLVLFIVPGVTSGAIAGERERQTLVPLQVTLLGPGQIVAGKLAASFAFLALLVVATAPLLAIAYLIGGVTMGGVVRGLVVVLFTGLVLTCLTVAASAAIRRVQGATVAAYALVLVLVLGSVVAYEAAWILDESRGADAGDPPVEILAVNPLFAAADFLADDDAVGGGDFSSPFEPMQSLLRRGDARDSRVETLPAPRPLPGGGVVVSDEVVGRFGQRDLDDGGWPFWATSAIVLTGLAALGARVAVLRLRTPALIER